MQECDFLSYHDSPQYLKDGPRETLRYWIGKLSQLKAWLILHGEQIAEGFKNEVFLCVYVEES